MGKKRNPAKLQGPLDDLEVGFFGGVPRGGVLEIEIPPKEQIRRGGRGVASARARSVGLPCSGGGVKARDGETGSPRIGPLRQIGLQVTPRDDLSYLENHPRMGN